LVRPDEDRRKKIKRDNDPSKGATYAMLDDTMSKISVHSSVCNTGVRRKRATADDDDSVVIGTTTGGGTKSILMDGGAQRKTMETVLGQW